MPVPDKVRLLLDWTLDAKHSLFVEGLHRGLYAARGIELSILQPEKKSSLALERLFSDEADLVINYPHNILLLQKEYPGIISVGSLVQKNPEGLLSLARAGIHAPADLQGRRIGVGPSPVSQAQLEVFLSENGISTDSVDLVTVGFEGEELLLRGEIDALDAVSYAIPRTTGKGFAVNFLPYAEHGVPDSPFLVFAARKDWAESNPDLPRRFFAATRQGLESVLGWGAVEWDEYAKKLPGKKSGSEEMVIWKRTYALMNPEGLFLQDVPRIAKLAEMLERKGILETGYDLEALFPANYIA
jgi:ABC-type nitrate/sulfonate/bicarbonate transport system substrate-binding protein